MVESPKNPKDLSNWKQSKKLIMQELVKLGILPEGFTGNFTVHLNAGSICDIKIVVEKSLLHDVLP